MRWLALIALFGTVACGGGATSDARDSTFCQRVRDLAGLWEQYDNGARGDTEGQIEEIQDLLTRDLPQEIHDDVRLVESMNDRQDLNEEELADLKSAGDNWTEYMVDVCGATYFEVMASQDA